MNPSNPNGPHNLATTHLRTEGEYKTLEVDTSKAHYFGFNWKDLGQVGKRKFETMVMLTNTPHRTHIIYV